MRLGEGFTGWHIAVHVAPHAWVPWSLFPFFTDSLTAARGIRNVAISVTVGEALTVRKFPCLDFSVNIRIIVNIKIGACGVLFKEHDR